MKMVEIPSVVERVFFGKSHPITYLFFGFVGSAFIGFMVLYLYSYLGRFAAHNYQEIPPVIVMSIGVSLLTIAGLCYSVWLWFGCWMYFKQRKHWLPSILLGFAIAHAGITILLVVSFVALSVDMISELNRGLWILGM